MSITSRARVALAAAISVFTPRFNAASLADAAPRSAPAFTPFLGKPRTRTGTKTAKPGHRKHNPAGSKIMKKIEKKTLGLRYCS